VTPHAVKTGLQDIQCFRASFLQETDVQIRYDACHGRGWTDSYMLKVDAWFRSVTARSKGNADKIAIPSLSFT